MSMLELQSLYQHAVNIIRELTKENAKRASLRQASQEQSKRYGYGGT